VNTGKGKAQRRSFPAKAPLPFIAVNTTAPGTEKAFFVWGHLPVPFFYTLFQVF
jgi:hypothetical protein